MLHIAPENVQLSAYMSKIDSILAEARAVRDRLKDQVASVEKSIATFERLRREVPAETLDMILSRHAQSNPEAIPTAPDFPTQDAGKWAGHTITPNEVVICAQEELLAQGRPMKRGELVRALEKKGVVLAGKDKNKNLGTILWRHARDFISVESLGYWVKGVPLEGIYDPERDDEPLPKTTFVKRRSNAP